MFYGDETDEFNPSRGDLLEEEDVLADGLSDDGLDEENDEDDDEGIKKINEEEGGEELW